MPRVAAMATALVMALPVSGVNTPGGRIAPRPAPIGSVAIAEQPADPAAAVRTESALRAAWADPRRTRIDLGADVVLRDCFLGDPIRESPFPLVLDGHGHTIRQACFEKRVLRQDGTGWLDVRNVALTRGGSDGPGAALTSRGEIKLSDCAIEQNLSEEPGGGVFSMRRVTVHRCTITGNLANDDGGGIYARRGGVQVYDSVLSTNLVDGSGGAIGSTGDILVVRSKVDGNTTDGDGGALYADEDGDVTVVESLIDGSDADGPGGAIFTLDGDVAVFDSTLIGNRADDRGGAIAGEADVLVVNSTIARNLAVAHAGGGIWARGDLLLVNSTVTNNYAEGEGGGLLSAGRVALVYSTLVRNIAPVGGDVGAAGVLESFASILGPTVVEGITGDTIPTRRSCRVYRGVSAWLQLPPRRHLRAHPSDRPDRPGPGPGPARGRPQRLRARATDRQPRPGPDPERLLPGPAADQHPGRPAARGLGRLGRGPDTRCRRQRPRHRARLRHRRCSVPLCRRTSRAPGPLPSGRVGPYRQVGPTAAADLPPTVPDRPLGREPESRRPPYHRGYFAALERLDRRLSNLWRRSGRIDTLLRCTSEVGVAQAGDARHRWGFLFDERDGTGMDLRPALTRDRTRPRWFLLRSATSRRCLSSPADPNGAGDDARPAGRSSGAVQGLDGLLRHLRRLEATTAAVTGHTERFDDWASCLSWLPITEDGDADQHLGFLRSGGQAPGPAVHLDASEWDDPDYQILAFGRADRPFRDDECGSDPGEGVDRPAVPRRATPTRDLEGLARWHPRPPRGRL